jgi:hypothetical protein
MTIGRMKLCIRIFEKAKKDEGGPEYQEEQAEWKATMEWLDNAFTEARCLSVRAYLLSADGLIPHSGKSDPNTYLWSRITESEADKTNCDNSTVREHSLHPEFNKVHVFEKCELPQNCLLELKVMEQVPGMLGGAPSDAEVGNTVLDIEDRWFHPRYAKWFEDNLVPIEARAIRSEVSAFNHGHVRCWIEVMTTDEANTKPITVLPSADPRVFQLRLVIWKASDIYLESDSSPDVYLQGKHTMDDGTILVQETDVHYSADDQIATWNWRWLFDVRIPCQDPRIQFTMWDHNLVSSSEPICDATMDFTKDFLQAKKDNAVVELARGTIPMCHPSKPGETCALLELQGVLMPIDEAMMEPVGEGWAEPNQDPFLDQEDPHLVAHRGLLSNLDAVKNLKAMGGMLFMGFGLMTAVYVVVAAVGGLVSFIITIYMMQSTSR